MSAQPAARSDAVPTPAPIPPALFGDAGREARWRDRFTATRMSRPAWARDAGCTSFACPPADPATFATFAQKLAERLHSGGFGGG